MNIKNRNWFQGLDVQKKLPRAAELIELLLGVIILLHCIVSTAGMVFSVNVIKLFYNPAEVFEQQHARSMPIEEGAEGLRLCHHPHAPHP